MQSVQEQKQLAPRARKNIQAVRQAGLLATLFALAVSLSGCAAVKGIFKAGMWVGILGVIFIVALVAGGASLFRGRSR